MTMNSMASASTGCGLLLAAILANTSLMPVSAHADDKIFDELRFGASASIQGGDSREDGVFPEVTVFFDPFNQDTATDWKQALARPRVNVGTSIGTSGEATQIFGGLSWTVNFNEKLFAEAGFGGVWHNGNLNNSADGPESWLSFPVPRICRRRLPYRCELERDRASRPFLARQPVRRTEQRHDSCRSSGRLQVLNRPDIALAGPLSVNSGLFSVARRTHLG